MYSRQKLIMTTERKLIEERTLLRRYAAGERNFARLCVSTMSIKNADLRDINLSGSNLMGVDLSGTDFSNANLSGANLIATNLTNVNLTHANLCKADLSGAICTRANFSHACLQKAILTAAIFSEANFYRVSIGVHNVAIVDSEIVLIANDFRGATNLFALNPGTFLYRTFWEDGRFFDEPTWMEQ